MHALEWIAEHGRFKRVVYATELRKLLSRAKGECTWCGLVVSPPKRAWCSRECKNAFMERCWPARIERLLFERDGGVCAKCGTDTDAIGTRLNTMYWRAYRKGPCCSFVRVKRLMRRHGTVFGNRLWEADHIVPVIEGGGLCGIDGYRTLCIRCHRLETAELAARRALDRRRAKDENCQTLFMDCVVEKRNP